MQASDIPETIKAIAAMAFAPKVRKWIYGVALASVPVLVYLEVIEPEAAALAGPFLLALLNVPEDSEDE